MTLARFARGAIVGGLLAVGGLSPVFTAAVAAQSRSVLELIDFGDRAIAPGETRVGELSDADWRSGNDAYLQAWALTLAPGQRVAIDLVSDAFDAYLLVVGPGLTNTLSDDDGAGGCNARVEIGGAEGGTYRVVATSLGSRNGGAFTLSATSNPRPPTAASCDAGGGATVDTELLAGLDPQGRLLSLDGEGMGELSELDRRDGGDLLQAWAFEGTAGASLTFDLVSREFDTYLYLIGPGLEVQTDDDTGGACNARITATLPEDGEYRVIVSSFGTGAGQFALRASSVAGPPADGPCPGSSGGLSPDTLLAMPVAGPPLTMGDTVLGALSANDAMFEEAFVQAWEYVATAGQAFTVDLRSEVFDALLHVAGPDMVNYTRDDDGGGACHSRAVIRPSVSGSYRIVATSIGRGVGEYLLSVSAAPGPASDAACGDTGLNLGGGPSLEELDAAGRMIEIGSSRTGEITDADRVDSSMFQAWEFAAAAGESVTIDLMSDAFDAYLYLTGPGVTAPLTDDDGGDGLNSRITTVLPEAGIYRIVVSQLGQETGFFTLQLSRNP